MEILLVLTVLSFSLFPLVHIIAMTSPVDLHTDDEYMATLLAQHVMETIIAKRANNPNYLPSVSDFRPVVASIGTLEQTSEFFNDFKEFNGPVSENLEPQLYWAMNKFKCRVDTYLLDDALFKVVVYITYVHDGRDMKVYVERLFAQNSILPQENDNKEEGF